MAWVRHDAWTQAQLELVVAVDDRWVLSDNDFVATVLAARGVEKFDVDAGPLAPGSGSSHSCDVDLIELTADGIGAGQEMLAARIEKIIDLHQDIGVPQRSGNTVAPEVDYGTIAQYEAFGYWQRPESSYAPHHFTTTITYDLGGLSTDEERLLATIALRAWADVCNLTFVPNDPNGGPAQIIFSDAGTQTAGTTPVFSGPNYTSALINISADWVDENPLNYPDGSLFDSYLYQTYIHEIGHALGLGHTGPYNFSAATDPTYGADNIFANDTWQFAVMSYFPQSNLGDSSDRYVMTPQVADCIAVAILYGAAPHTRDGNTTYGFNSTAAVEAPGGPLPFDVFNFANYAVVPALTIYDSAGIDTLDCTGYAANQYINLFDGSFSSVGGLVNNIAIAVSTTIEIAKGGIGNDTIVGNDANNALYGGDGNDILVGGFGGDFLEGGVGQDIAAYTHADSAVTVNLADPAANIGEAFGDTYSSIEVIMGSIYSDTFIGDTTGNSFEGGAGADSFDGGIGYDFATYLTAPAAVVASLAEPDGNSGEAAGDRYFSVEGLVGSDFDDHLVGDQNFNILIGGRGADTLDGQAGFDLANYASATAGLQASLADPDINTGDANGDQYISIEGLVGSSFNDLLVGDDSINALEGGGGADSLNGGNGLDFASYVTSSAGVVASLFDADANTGDAAGDVYNSIEGLIGSSFNDTLTGTSSGNNFVGGLGNDEFHGQLGFDFADYSTLFSGFYGGLGSLGLVASLVNPNSNTGVAAGDTYESIEGLVGSDFADALFGDAIDNVLIGNGGDDTLDGAFGTDLLTGGLGNDAIVGGAGFDELHGDDGGDTLGGGDQGDLLFGDDGNDSINGGMGLDTIDGGSGSDTVNGGVGSDAIFGNLGFDEIHGNDGDDTINGGDQGDVITGDAGNDFIGGGMGLDAIDGGAGDDTITGGMGTDTLTGGADADSFAFASPGDANDGVDTITDLVSGADVIQISAAGYGGGLVEGGAVTLVMADAAADANSGGTGYFILDNSGADSGTLYWDVNGGNGSDAVAIAVLTGVTSLQASDLHVV